MKYDINLEAHLRYVSSQKHTRGDLARAKNAFNSNLTNRNVTKPRMKGDISVSDAIRPVQRTETTGNTSYITYCGKDVRLSAARCRVMKA